MTTVKTDKKNGQLSDRAREIKEKDLCHHKEINSKSTIRTRPLQTNDFLCPRCNHYNLNRIQSFTRACE